METSHSLNLIGALQEVEKYRKLKNGIRKQGKTDKKRTAKRTAETSKKGRPEEFFTKNSN